MDRPGLQAKLLILSEFDQRGEQSPLFLPSLDCNLRARPALAPCVRSGHRVA